MPTTQIVPNTLSRSPEPDAGDLHVQFAGGGDETNRRSLPLPEGPVVWMSAHITARRRAWPASQASTSSLATCTPAPPLRPFLVSQATTTLVRPSIMGQYVPCALHSAPHMPRSLHVGVLMCISRLATILTTQREKQ